MAWCKNLQQTQIYYCFMSRHKSHLVTFNWCWLSENSSSVFLWLIFVIFVWSYRLEIAFSWKWTQHFSSWEKNLLNPQNWGYILPLIPVHICGIIWLPFTNMNIHGCSGNTGIQYYQNNNKNVHVYVCFVVL